MSIRNLPKPKIVVVCGPTASGKTGLSIELCKKFNGEIVNADSRQVYREMDIGTAKGLDKNVGARSPRPNLGGGTPPLQTIRGVPIHLVDIVEPDERYNVGRFKEDAEEAIEDTISRGKVPFIVGGTGMYIDALVENFQLAEEDPWNDRRQSVTGKTTDYRPSIQDSGAKTIQELVSILADLDPEALNTVDLKNRRRVERALEYCLTTGERFSESRRRGERKYEVLKLAPAVSLDREKLYEKINKRVPEMVEEGLEDEVKALAEKYGWESEAMTGIGYREWNAFSIKSQIPNPKSQTNPKPKIQKGNIVDSIVEEIKKNTRNYAKRQITWFKRDKEINYIDLKKAESLVRQFLAK